MLVTSETTDTYHPHTVFKAASEEFQFPIVDSKEAYKELKMSYWSNFALSGNDLVSLSLQVGTIT